MKRTVQFTRYYYKTVTKEVEVPNNITADEQEDWILENASINPDEYIDKPLQTEDDDIFILE